MNECVEISDGLGARNLSFEFWKCHREMGLRQVEIAFSLILANFLNDFFKEEHNKMLENF